LFGKPETEDLVSYRKISVDNVDWEWTVGSSHVKMRRADKTKSMDVSRYSLMGDEESAVTPKIIADFIRNGPYPLDRVAKAKKLQQQHKVRLIDEVKKIRPSEFINFDVLKSHLPVFITPSDPDNPPNEEQLDNLADKIATELIEAKFETLKPRDI